MADAESQEQNSDEESWSDQDMECKCLFTDEMKENSLLVFKDAKENHGFDFDAICKQFKLDFYKKIKILNFVRAKVKVGLTPEEIVNSLGHTADWEDDEYLKPTLENDTLLFQIPESTDEPPQTLEDENKELKQVIQQLLEDSEKMKKDYVDLLNSIDMDGTVVQSTQESYFDQIDRITEKIVPNIHRYWDEENSTMKTPAQLIFDRIEGRDDAETGRLFLQWLEKSKEDPAMQPFMTHFSEYLYEQEDPQPSKGAGAAATSD